MSTINCLIVDDEPLAREILQTYIAGVPGWKLVQRCMSAVEAYGALHEHDIDVMFLDIQMPVVSGIDFLHSLKHPPLVVFTTAFSNHAVEGFALNAVDYLLKPITNERFLQAVDKLHERLAGKNTVHLSTNAPAADYVFIKQDARLVKLHFDDILYAEAQRDFTYIFLKQKKILASMHLKMLEDLLPENRFLRIHRSYMINVSAISAINGNMVEIDQHEIPIGANYKDKLFSMLGL
ncbi:MAG: response regulator [Bacteroidota bacterium]